MSHYFYRYQVYERDGIEYTLLKWLENGVFNDTRKIDKPTLYLTNEDIYILNQFFDEGGIAKPKYEAIIPTDSTDLDV